MSGPIHIGSTTEWQSLLADTNVVIADFYADWCGPCKMIAPHFEALAKQHSSPKKVAFAKINVDVQTAIARSNSVAAMPTFKIFHGGACVDTIKGANPPALTAAVDKAVKLGGAERSGTLFKTPGRQLGGEGLQPPRRASSWNFGWVIRAIVTLVGLYFASLFSFDGYKAAEKSPFNIHRRAPPRPAAGSAGPGKHVAKPASKPTFKTLADLGGD